MDLWSHRREGARMASPTRDFGGGWRSSIPMWAVFVTFAKRAWRVEWLPMAALVAANVVLGILLAPHYGQSIDEAANVKYGELSLRSYLDPLNPYRDPSREDKGPFYLMLWSSASSVIPRVVHGWLPVDARHFVNFLAW